MYRWTANGSFTGGAESVLPSTPEWQTVHVPLLLGQIGDKPFMWYRRTINVPQDWTGRRLFVRFEAVRFVSEVYVDGQKVGGHYGGWEPFEVDVTKVCRPGAEHHLLVRVQDMTGVCEQALDYSKRLPGGRIVDQLKDSIMAPIGSQGERVGIWQSTSLVARNEVYVEDVFVKTSVRRKEISAEVTVRNLGSNERTVRCSATVEGGVTFEPVQVTVAGASSKTVTLVQAWPAPRLWCPTDPHLYQFITQLELDGRQVDRQATRFGFREFWVEGPEFVLNGTPMKFLATAGHPRGNLDSELSKQGALDLFRRIREAGCVAMRLHANIWPRDWYEAADEVGLPVVMESALFCWCRAYAMTCDEFWKNYHEHLAAVIRAHRNHPSIVMTSLENEILHCGGEQVVPGTTHRLAEAGRMVKALDPTRPILFDGDNDPEGVADVVNLHYPLNFNKQNLWPDVAYWLETGMEVACNPRCFWNWDRKKPLYMGEFLHIQHFNEAEPYSVLLGDDAFRGHREAMARAKAMAWEMQIEGYRATGLTGMCPWTLLETGPFPSDENPRYLAVKRSYEKNAAFIRQYDSRFYAGEQVDRKVYLYNDTPAKACLQCVWQLARGRQIDDQGQQTFELAPAQSKPFDIRLHMPKVEQETDVTLTLRVQNAEKEVFTRAWMYRVYPRRPLDVPKGLHMLVFGQLPDNLKTMLQNAGVTLTKLDRLDQPPLEGVILVAPHALDADPIGQTGAAGGVDGALGRLCGLGRIGSGVGAEPLHRRDSGQACGPRLHDRLLPLPRREPDARARRQRLPFLAGRSRRSPQDDPQAGGRSLPFTGRFRWAGRLGVLALAGNRQRAWPIPPLPIGRERESWAWNLSPSECWRICWWRPSQRRRPVRGWAWFRTSCPWGSRSRRSMPCGTTSPGISTRPT